MKKEYIKPVASLVDALDNYCKLNFHDVSGYGADHTTTTDDLYEEE